MDERGKLAIIPAPFMKRVLPFLIVAASVVTFFSIRDPLERPTTGLDSSRSRASMMTGVVPAAGPVATVPPNTSISVAEPVKLPEIRADIRWQEEVSEPAFESFRTWTTRYIAALPQERLNMETAGVAAATARRSEMMAMIKSDPQRAVERAVPVTVWRQMPVAVRAHLETRVDTKGDVLVQAYTPLAGQKPLPNTLSALIGDDSFTAFGEGRNISKFRIPLSGVKLAAADKPGEPIIALSKNAGRILEPVEVAEAKASLGTDALCQTSGEPSAANEAEVALSIGGTTNFFCGPAHAASALDGATQVALAPDIAEAGPFQASGNKKILIYRVDFSDYQGQRVDQATLETLIRDLRSFWDEMSYGAFMWVPPGVSGSQVTPVLRLPLTADSYTNLGTFIAACRTASRNAGYDPNDYDFDMVVTARYPTASFGGVGYVGGKGCWLANSLWDLSVGTHELGHNVSLNHANYWDVAGTDPAATNGTSVEYGDGIDMMGTGGVDTRRHFNVRQKNQLTWAANSTIFRPAQGSAATHRIYAMDKKSTGTGNLMRGIHINRLNSNNDWWIDYRQLYAASNAYAKNGVWIRWGGPTNEKTNLIDMNPRGTKDDAPLLIGKTHADRSDATNHIFITPMARGNVDPDWVDVYVRQVNPTVSQNSAPTAAVNATNTTPAANVNTTLTVTANDPEGDVLSYFWEMGDGAVVVNNLPSITYKYPTTGARTVRCTVSDRRGGTATGSKVINVGGQSIFFISGTVANIDGVPFEGVTVSAGGTRTDVTDSSGNYTITNLPAGSHTLTATKPGLTINLAAGTTNPIVVSTLDRTGVNFTVATGAPSLGAMQSAISDSGSNTGDITLPLTDPDSLLTSITLTGTSSNTALIPNANITFGTRGSGRTCRVSAPANVTGSVVITIIARDPQNNQTSTTWAVTINNNPTITGTSLTTQQDTAVETDLRPRVTDDFAANTAIAFELSRVIGGTAELLADGFTARFTPTPGYQGPASFRVTGRDQSLSSRLTLLYDFEPPDVETDGKTFDYGNYHFDGILDVVGTSEYNYLPDSPAPLKPFSTRSLSFSDNGVDSAARLLRVISVNDLDFSNNAAGWSFSTWVNRRSNASEDIIFHVGAGDGDGPEDELKLFFPANEEKILLTKYAASGFAGGLVANNVGVNQWHHVVVTCTIDTPGQGAFSLYLDGFLVGTTPAIPLAFDQSAPIVFGGHAEAGNPGRWLDGSLDDVSLYSNVLPHADVAGLATFGTRHYLGQEASADITVTITGPNDAPTVEPIANRRVPTGSTTDTVPVLVSDAETPVRDLIVSATSSNQALVPNANLVFVATAPWVSTDVGIVGTPGSTIESAGTMVVRGSGAQIETTQDEFRLVHLPMTGDGEVITRVVSMDYTHEKGRSGIMFRAGTTDNAPFAFVGVGPGSSAIFQARASAGATTGTIGEAARIPMPRWLRLVRTGSTITASHAADNAGIRGAWISLGSTTLVLPSTVNAGLAVNSHVHATLATTLFDNISGDIANGARRKLIILPVAGVPGTATITVTVSDGLLSANTSFDFSTNTAPTISAIADQGLEQGTTSAALPVTVGDEETDAASITLTGTSNNQSIIANAGITFNGTGADRTVSLQAKPGVKGLVEITLTANDGQLTSTRKFRVFVAPAGTMVVNVAGFGKLSGYFGETTQTPGRQITISAKAVGGQAFQGWRGVITSYDPQITFTMPAVIYLEAMFGNSPYPRQSGVWNGLILDDPRTHAHTGGIVMNVSASGAYSGKLTYGGKPWSFRGILHTDGTAGDSTILRKELESLKLRFSWNGTLHSMSGTLTEGTTEAAFTAQHALYTTSKRPEGAQRPIPANLLGKVTALFTADPTAGPTGTGFATGSVAGSGAVKLAGKFADGTPFSSGSFMSISGDVPFHVDLYKGLGSASGYLAWRNIPGSDFTGSVTMFRPADPLDPTFSTGWPDGATLTTAGSYFVKPHAARSGSVAVLPFPELLADDADGNATLFLEGAGYLGETREAHISPVGKLSLTALPDEKMSLALKTSNGLLTGASSLNGKSIKLCGAILQKANTGAGFSITTGAAGGFDLELSEP